MVDSGVLTEFTAGPARITVAGTGQVVSVGHQDRPDLDYLRAPVYDLSSGGQRWRTVRSRREADEIEVVRAGAVAPTAPVLRLTIRHTFTPTWNVRLVWSNVGEVPDVLDPVGVPFRAGLGCLAWGVAAGEDAGCALLPLDGAGPVLGGRLRRGHAVGLNAAGLVVRPIALDPGESAIVHWEWDWHPTPVAYGRGRHAHIPWALTGAAGQPVSVPAGPDAVVLVNTQAVDPEGDRVPVDDPGRPCRVEVRSAFGTAAFGLEWARPLPELVDLAVDHALGGARSATNVPRLHRLEQALLLQYSVGRGRGADPLAAEDALDAFSAAMRTVKPHTGTDPLLAAFWCGEYARTGDAEYVTAAVAVLAAHTRIRPDLGLAGVQTLLSCLAAGLPEAPLRRQLAALAADSAHVTGARPPTTQPPTARVPANRSASGRSSTDQNRPAALADVAARLELLAGAAADRTTLLRRRLGVCLGAGLKGRAAESVPVAERAYAVAVIEALPESVSAALVAEWGCSLLDLGRREAAAVNAEVAGRVGAGDGEAERALIYLGLSGL